jgi:hypothetical protein
MCSLLAWTTLYQCNTWAILNYMSRLNLDLALILNFGEFPFGRRNAINVIPGCNRGGSSMGKRRGLQVRHVQTSGMG